LALTGLLGQDSLDRLLHAGAIGPNHEKIEACLVGVRSKPDRIKGPCLSDQSIDRLQLCCRRELKAREVGRAVKLIRS
jgi:hypothetical protein